MNGFTVRRRGVRVHGEEASAMALQQKKSGVLEGQDRTLTALNDDSFSYSDPDSCSDRQSSYFCFALDAGEYGTYNLSQKVTGGQK